jgi:hypothetical protein
MQVQPRHRSVRRPLGCEAAAPTFSPREEAFVVELAVLVPRGQRQSRLHQECPLEGSGLFFLVLGS